MNWGLMANKAWDYPADSLGFTSGLAIELNQPLWALRYGIFAVPPESNGMGVDWHLLEAWGMVTEFERRYTIAEHPGTVRLLAYLNQAHMGSYQDAVDNYNQNPTVPANINTSQAYRSKYGFGLNAEQELTENLGAFARAGWSDGHNQAWMFSDVDYTASLGISVKGAAWHRSDDTFGLAGVFNGISSIHQDFFADGGTGILAGDGNLHYSIEQILETYYDCGIWKTLHAALDYQFVTNPVFNQDRGPVSVFGARVHWEF
jgi:high affinity Mn2+ porin